MYNSVWLFDKIHFSLNVRYCLYKLNMLNTTYEIYVAEMSWKLLLHYFFTSVNGA